MAMPMGLLDREILVVTSSLFESYLARDERPPQRPRQESSPVGNGVPVADNLVDLPGDVS